MMENQKKILIVDDETDIVEILKLRLETSGYSVVTAFDGVEALEQVAREKPDLVLLDVKMPRLNGYKVTKTLREDSKTREIPIIIVTALSKYNVNMAQKCKELGIKEVFFKPFDAVKLLSRIRECLQS